MEKLKLTAKSSHPRFQAIGKYQKSIVVEKMGNSILIISVIILISILGIDRAIFKLHEEKRNSIYKPDNIRSSTIKFTIYLQFFDCQKIIIFRILKINNRSLLYFCLSIWFFYCNWNSIPK